MAIKKYKSKISLISFFLISTAVVILAVLIFGRDYYIINNFRLEAQKKSFWCWAAGTKMILDYTKNYQDTIPQCEIVNQRFNIQYRGNSPYSNQCSCQCSNTCDSIPGNIGLNDSTIYGKILRQNGLASSIKKVGILSWTKMKSEIKGNYPILFHNIFFSGDLRGMWSGNHVVVASGFIETPSHKFLFINDPWKRCKGCSYLLDYTKLANPRTNSDTALIRNNIDSRGITTIYHVRKVSTTITQRVYFSLQRFSVICRSYFNELVKSEKSGFTDEILTIKNFNNEVFSQNNPDIEELLGFDPGSKNLSYDKPFQIKNFDETKILKSNSKNLEDFVSKENTLKIVNIRSNSGATVSEITLSKAKNGNDIFWNVDKISKCDFLKPVKESSEVYSLETPSQRLAFEKVKIKDQDFFVPLDTYLISSISLKTISPLSHIGYLDNNVLKKGQPYSAEKIIYSLKTILNQY